MSFSKEFLDKVIDSIRFIDLSELEKMVDILVEVRKTGRLFIIGSGGGAGHASHAVCDFRKLCGIDAFTLDNISEITARTNDEGWATSTVNWLKISNISDKDCLMVFSVGGGTANVSVNISNAVSHAKIVHAKIIGIVGRDGGITKQLADATILIQAKEYTTPIVEGLQAVLWHCIITNPKLQINKTKW